MDYLSAFQMMDQQRPFVEGTYDPTTHQPTYQPPQDSTEMGNIFTLYRTQQPLYNVDGYISPYPTNNWDNTSSTILNFIDDQGRLPALEQKLDPNKIYNSDIAALRTLAADQSKITKMFEKRLVESLTDKGKFGLTEDDVIAMQALTSARAAITAINKEQINIKKNIAELKIKQQQNARSGSMMNNGSSDEMSGVGNTFSEAKNMMDRIFNMPAVTANTTVPANYQAETVSLDRAAEVLVDIIPDVNELTKYEAQNPTTYVVIGDTDDDISFETYSEDGTLIENYPKPDVDIDINSINREAKTAMDTRLVEYPVKFRNE